MCEHIWGDICTYGCHSLCSTTHPLTLGFPCGGGQSYPLSHGTVSLLQWVTCHRCTPRCCRPHSILYIRFRSDAAAHGYNQAYCHDQNWGLHGLHLGTQGYLSACNLPWWDWFPYKLAPTWHWSPHDCWASWSWRGRSCALRCGRSSWERGIGYGVSGAAWS